MTELIVDSVCPKGPIYPMIVNFQNGYPSEDFEVNCALLQDRDGSRMIATELSDIVYAGKEVTEDLGKTIVVARNRKTGKVRLIEVGYAELKPVSKSDLDTTQPAATSTLELSRKFGSKKQKKKMEQHERLKVNVQTVTEQMEKVTANVTVDQLDLSSYDKNDSDTFYIPPINRDATKVEDVYPLEKIMSEDDYEKISSDLQGRDYASEMHPYMQSFIKGKNLTPRLTVLAVYASELLKFFPLKFTEIRKKGLLAVPYSNTLNDILLNGFTVIQNGKRTRPQSHKDKLLCHLIVFLLLLNNFKFEVEPICAVLKTTIPTFSMKARVVGAVVGYSSEKKVVVLKLPLPSASKGSFNRRKSAKF